MHAASLPSSHMPEAGEFALGDVEEGVRSLAVGSLSQGSDLSPGPPGPPSPAAPSQAASPRCESACHGGRGAGVEDGTQDEEGALWLERQRDEAALLALQKEVRRRVPAPATMHGRRRRSWSGYAASNTSRGGVRRSWPFWDRARRSWMRRSYGACGSSLGAASAWHSHDAHACNDWRSL